MFSLFTALATTFALVYGTPRVALPFNSQVPQVAHAGEQYSFTFSSSIFEGSDGPVRYNLQGAPSWLKINSESLTLYGLPTEKDIGSFDFTLLAADNSGQAGVLATMVVRHSSGLTVGADIRDALLKAGNLASLHIQPH